MARFGQLIVGVIASAVIALASWRRGSLTSSGALAALIVGASIFTGGGLGWFLALLAFFVSSTLLARVGAAHKARLRLEYAKGDTRDAWQVIANGGVAAACAVAQHWLPAIDLTPAFLGALATANGDTWATELGVLGTRPPVLVTTLRRVPAGSSGAISGLGVAATIVGGAAIGLVVGVAEGAHVWMWIGVGGLAGGLGALADSVLGATIQAGYRCLGCDLACEGPRHHCGLRARHVRGIRWFGNDAVNLTATAIGAAAAMLLVS